MRAFDCAGQNNALMPSQKNRATKVLILYLQPQYIMINAQRKSILFFRIFWR